MKWFMVHTNNGWRIFSEELFESYLPTISTGLASPVPTSHVVIELPGADHPDRQVRFNVDGLDIDTPREDLKILSALLRNVDTDDIGGRECVKLRGRMEGAILTSKQRWNLVDQIHTFMKGWQND